MTFTIDSIINPGSLSTTGAGNIIMLDEKGSELDIGTWQMPSGYFLPGNITKFTAVPESTTVGLPNVKYTFRVTPSGDIARYSYLLLDLPEQLKIADDEKKVRLFEDKCGENLFGFPSSTISCEVKSGGRQIKIKDGFLYQGTTNFTDADGIYMPPELGFTLAGFANPRESGTFGPFNVSIYNSWDKLLYSW